KLERSLTHGRVAEGVNVTEERRIANCGVAVGNAVSARVIREQRGRTDRRVGSPIVIIKERLKTERGVVVGSGGRGWGEVIKEERVGSNGRVVVGSDVEQQRSRAGCGIGIPVVEVQRSGADSGIEKAVRYEPSRVPPKPGIEPAGHGGRVKGVEPLDGVATANVSLLRLRSGQKPKADKDERDEKEPAP